MHRLPTVGEDVCTRMIHACTCTVASLLSLGGGPQSRYATLNLAERGLSNKREAGGPRIRYVSITFLWRPSVEGTPPLIAFRLCAPAACAGTSFVRAAQLRESGLHPVRRRTSSTLSGTRMHVLLKVFSLTVSIIVFPRPPLLHPR